PGIPAAQPTTRRRHRSAACGRPPGLGRRVPPGHARVGCPARRRGRRVDCRTARIQGGGWRILIDMPRDWDARTYDRVADPMTRWGEAVLDRLPLAGDERVLDAGCGSGRVTELLAGRLPRGRVVALDGSTAMVEAARQRL